MNQNRTVDISQEQMRQAATAGVQLLNTPGAVNVPGPMAVTDSMKILNRMLSAIANGEVAVVNITVKQEKEDGKTPPDNDEAKKLDLKSVDTGKQAEK